MNKKSGFKVSCDECHREVDLWDFVEWENEYGVKFENCKKCAEKCIKIYGGKLSMEQLK